MKNYAEEIKEFYEYVWNFYNNTNGIYPIATTEKIQQSVNRYLESKPLSQIYFDSFDREGVRMIIEPGYSIFLPK
jgi:hypothetical protein